MTFLPRIMRRVGSEPLLIFLDAHGGSSDSPKDSNLPLHDEVRSLGESLRRLGDGADAWVLVHDFEDPIGPVPRKRDDGVSLASLQPLLAQLDGWCFFTPLYTAHEARLGGRPLQSLVGFGLVGVGRACARELPFYVRRWQPENLSLFHYPHERYKVDEYTSHPPVWASVGRRIQTLLMRSHTAKVGSYTAQVNSSKGVDLLDGQLHGGPGALLAPMTNLMFDPMLLLSEGTVTVNVRIAVLVDGKLEEHESSASWYAYMTPEFAESSRQFATLGGEPDRADDSDTMPALGSSSDATSAVGPASPSMACGSGWPHSSGATYG